MAVVSVEVPNSVAKSFESYSVIPCKKFLEHTQENLPSFDFKDENINQEDFLAYLRKING